MDMERFLSNESLRLTNSFYQKGLPMPTLYNSFFRSIFCRAILNNLCTELIIIFTNRHLFNYPTNMNINALFTCALLCFLCFLCLIAKRSIFCLQMFYGIFIIVEISMVVFCVLYFLFLAIYLLKCIKSAQKINIRLFLASLLLVTPTIFLFFWLLLYLVQSARLSPPSQGQIDEKNEIRHIVSRTHPHIGSTQTETDLY